jgi:hypothetical protein
MKEFPTRSPSLRLLIGPAAWLVNTLAGYSLQPLLCRYEVAAGFALGAVLLAAISIAGAFWSYESLAPSSASDIGENPRLFVAALGAASGVLFSVGILLQASAAFALTGCER